MGKRQREAGKVSRQKKKEAIRFITAVHESGHAVVAVKLGIGVDSVEIFKQSTEHIEHAGGTLNFEGGAIGATRYLPNDLTDTQTLENKIVIALAGCEVNRILGIEALDMDYEDFFEQACKGDLLKATLFVYLLGLSPQDRKAVIPADTTVNIPIPSGAVTGEALDGHFKKASEHLNSVLDESTLETIQRVATRLHKQGRVTGDEIREELSVTQEADTVL